MEQIELVIKMPKRAYERFVMHEQNEKDEVRIANEIRNGTPLPKGHGRLIDKKDIDANCITYHTDYDGSWCYRVYDIENNVPTIIEADKGDE